MNKAVFLDRDGVINVDRNYVHKISDLRLIRGTAQALRILKEKGFLLIIVTNQSGIGRGYYTLENYKKLKDEIQKRLSKNNLKIDGEYFCPHGPEENCPCRKPNIKLIQDAAKDHGIDLTRSYFIGDKTSDILAGKNAGMKTILVRTGKAGKDKTFDVAPDRICSTLLDAAKIVS